MSRKKSKFLIYIYVLLYVFLSFNSLPSNSQKLPGDVKEVIDGTDEQEQDFYAGIVGKMSNIKDKWGFDLGISLGIKYGRTFGVGIGYYSLVTRNIEIKNEVFPKPATLLLDYGGLEFSYSIYAFKSFRITPCALFAIGRMTLSASENFGVMDANKSYIIFMTEPAVNFNLKISGVVWLSAGAGYRISLFREVAGFKASDLTCPVLILSVLTY